MRAEGGQRNKQRIIFQACRAAVLNHGAWYESLSLPTHVSTRSCAVVRCLQVEYACVVSLLAATAQGFLEQQQRRGLRQLQRQAQAGGLSGPTGAGAAPSILNYDEEVGGWLSES